MRKWQDFADNGACPVDLTGGETSPITKSALSLLGETLEREGGVFPVAPRGALFGICFLSAGVPLHFTSAGKWQEPNHKKCCGVGVFVYFCD